MVNQKGKQDKIRCLKQMNVQLNRMIDKMRLLKQMRSITRVNKKGKSHRILHLKQTKSITKLNQSEKQDKILC